MYLGAGTAPGSFDEFRRVVRLDQRVVVTDTSGVTHRGKLAGLSASTLQLRRGDDPWIAFMESEVNNVAITGADRWWNGMLIGFAVGATPVALAWNKNEAIVFVRPRASQARRLSIEPFFSGMGHGLRVVAQY